jgi:hypothetical protein
MKNLVFLLLGGFMLSACHPATGSGRQKQVFGSNEENPSNPGFPIYYDVYYVRIFQQKTN